MRRLFDRKPAWIVGMAFCFGLLFVPDLLGAGGPAKVYVILWFDTEDYILPASDDSALRLAQFLSRQKIRATFKVVGEKARTLERRGRTDVIAALKRHEIGYHANYHSVQPSPAMYLSNLGWDEGVAEFDRREGPGRDDVERIFGRAPTCYGQPGSSWAPESYPAMRRWGMQVYLDAGRHVGLEDKPFYYGGILNLYRLTYILRADLKDPKKLPEAEKTFLTARQHLLAEGGGIVSIFYHPCEFIHEEFWDGVNFRQGANPPRERWQLPPLKPPEQRKIAYQVFEDYIRFIQHFPEVQFITASEAAQLYRDQARGKHFTPGEIRAVAAGVGPQVTFQRRDNYTLSASEEFALLNAYVAARARGKKPEALELKDQLDGPSNPVPVLTEPVTVDWSLFTRTAVDTADYLARQKRIPTSVWLGSVPVPPEAYLNALARVTMDLTDGKPAPENVTVPLARLAAADDVAEDNPKLWTWVIFPPGFRAPRMMELAKREAWTLKPA
ncbi:MAG: hypothetical protein JO112_10360, partial [Planctomycetes bacterium]|nr:hypothetical protein [Planctomycetota bacterium]